MKQYIYHYKFIVYDESERVRFVGSGIASLTCLITKDNAFDTLCRHIEKTNNFHRVVITDYILFSTDG